MVDVTDNAERTYSLTTTQKERIKDAGGRRKITQDLERKQNAKIRCFIWKTAKRDNEKCRL